MLGHQRTLTVSGQNRFLNEKLLGSKTCNQATSDQNRFRIVVKHAAVSGQNRFVNKTLPGSKTCNQATSDQNRFKRSEPLSENLQCR